MSLSHSELKRLLHYDPETGIWTWKVRLSNRVRLHEPLKANTGKQGYVSICIYGTTYWAAKLAWFYVTGDWPPRTVDHQNAIRDDDRWTNLRLATRAQNNHNSSLTTRNKTGLKGVQTARQPRRYQARIKIPSGQRLYLGNFDCPAAAHFAYLIAADIHFGEFARAR